jgi:hypothetical protein
MKSQGAELRGQARVSLVDLVEPVGSEREQVSQLSQMGERRIYTPSTLHASRPPRRIVSHMCRDDVVDVGTSRDARVHRNDNPARDQSSGAHKSSSMVS